MTKTNYTYKKTNTTIEIDLNRDDLLSEAGVAIMRDRYLLKEYDNENKKWLNLENSPQECFARSACEFASNQDHAQRLYDYASKNWMMFATPILTNAGTEKGMPISCFLNYCDDSVVGILDHHYETGILSSYGGGVGGDWSSLRSTGVSTSRGNVSTGVIAFICMMDKEMLAFQQGATRRGSYAAYMDVGHPEIEEFIEIRKPALGDGDDIHRRCLGNGFHHAINIPDSFMVAVENGSKWDLIDPHTKEVRKSVDARTLWMKILTRRLETGEPYLHFIDTSNRALPEFLKKKGLRINNSNLCNEIMLPTNKDRTAVCCLSSVNLEYFDDWRDDVLFISDMVEMLDNVLDYFITNAPKQMWRAVESAKNERSIGLGAMGYHMYLQKKRIPFESPMAIGQNRTIFKHIKTKAQAASLSLGQTRGEAPDAKGTGQRFSHLMALAPNANIGYICGGTSPSIEPMGAAVTAKTLSGNFGIRNKVLDKILKEEYNLKDDELEAAWSSVVINKGSVQQLSFLSKEDKEVFKTPKEIDQMWLVEHAATRQEFLCQGQSVNLFIAPDIHVSDLHKIHHAAWKKGLKGLYYCRSSAIRATDKVSNTIYDEGEKETPDQYIDPQQVVFEQDSGECLSCEG